MRAMTSSTFGVVLLAPLMVLIACASSHAAGVSLMCSGTSNTYFGEHVEARLSPSAATLDLEARTFTSYLGTIQITSVTPTLYGFDSAAPVYLRNDGTAARIIGSLDRISGRVSVMYMHLDNPNQAYQIVELNCAKAQQQF